MPMPPTPTSLSIAESLYFVQVSEYIASALGIALDANGNPTVATASLGTNTSQIATTAFVLANGGPGGGGIVTSIFGRNGIITAMSGDYVVAQITGAAPLASPALSGVPTAPTASPTTNTTQIATTAYVQSQGYVTGNSISSVFSRTGAVTAQSGDYSVAQVTGAAPIASPTFTGVVAVPTPSTGDNSTAAASTAFVKSQGYVTSNPVASVFGRTGVVTAQSGDYGVAQITGAAPLVSPTFTGVPVAPTASNGTNTTQIATTAFVIANAGGSAVSTVFGRSGVVVATSGDYAVGQVTGAAPLASPTFTGTVTIPTPSTADNSTKAASTAYVQAQGFITSSAVTTVFTRSGAVTAQSGDYTVSQVTGAAPIASPTFTGVATIPTAAVAVHYGAWTTATDASTVTLDLSVTDKYTLTATSGVGSARTIAFANFAVGQVLILEFVQGGSGGPYTITWGPTIRWANGSAPALTSTGSHADQIVIVNRHDGTYSGALSIPNY